MKHALLSLVLLISSVLLLSVGIILITAVGNNIVGMTFMIGGVITLFASYLPNTWRHKKDTNPFLAIGIAFFAIGVATGNAALWAIGIIWLLVGLRGKYGP